jgi:hypothetical protein
MWSGCLGDIEWGMCEVRDPLGNALKMVKKHIKSAEKSNNQNGWRGIKQSKSHKYHFPIPLVFRIKTIKIPEKSREMDNTGHVHVHVCMYLYFSNSMCTHVALYAFPLTTQGGAPPKSHCTSKV